jgi:hypothetical protein
MKRKRKHQLHLFVYILSEYVRYKQTVGDTTNGFQTVEPRASICKLDHVLIIRLFDLLVVTLS